MLRRYLLPLAAVLTLSVGWAAGLADPAVAEDVDSCPAVSWTDVSGDTLGKIRFLPVDESITQHAHEIRGFVNAPLDYADPDGQQIRIFYRLMPDAREANEKTNSLPILVVMNGGPGVPSSAYRALDHNYSGENPDDAFANLSRHFRILAVDQRGTGNSSPLNLDDPSLSSAAIAKFFDSDEQAKDHARVIEAVIPKDEEFFILARSYGGHIGFQYLALDETVRQPAGYIFSSALLPHSDALETFIRRRQKQKELNIALKASHPQVVAKLNLLRSHFQTLGLDPKAVNFLWEYLGKGANWETALERKIDEYLSIDDRAKIEADLGAGIQQSVNLLNYVLSSAALTPGYTDRTVAEETSRRVPFKDWMLDETWTLVQIGNDGTWREGFVCSIDRNPPPPSQFQSIENIRASMAQTHALFTFGTTDAFLPHDLQVNSAKRFEAPGRTEFHVMPGGHGAAFSAEGSEFVAGWAKRVAQSEAKGVDFTSLMERVATGWSTNNTALALSAFASDAVYTEPPDLQFYEGKDQLKRFFNAVRPGSSMVWRNLWYDENSGFGAGEYSFRNGDRLTAVHGVAVVKIHKGKIQTWREYQQPGPVKFEDFHDTRNKQWKETIKDLE